MFYYRGARLYAVRKGPYKAHFFTRPAYGRNDVTEHTPPLLYHLENDPSEKYDISREHPDVIADLRREAERHKATLVPVEDQLAGRIGNR